MQSLRQKKRLIKSERRGKFLPPHVSASEIHHFTNVNISLGFCKCADCNFHQIYKNINDPVIISN